MNYQTYRPTKEARPTKKARQTNKQKPQKRNTFQVLTKRQITKSSYMNNQNQPRKHSCNQQTPHHVQFSLMIINNLLQTVAKIFHFYQQNKYITIKQFTRIQPHYSEDGDYFNQYQQRFYINPTDKNWNFDQADPNCQPDFFETYTRKQQPRQSWQNLPPRQNSAKNNNNFQSK